MVRFRQPPSGGCVLKLVKLFLLNNQAVQPPSGGCVLKLLRVRPESCQSAQPPSGGCVLKQQQPERIPTTYSQPPSGGCVLKLFGRRSELCRTQPAAFRRLCVETLEAFAAIGEQATSRLQAAVC